MQIICDFDGTITRRDTTDLVLERLAASAWRELEDDWLAGRITAAQCMRAQIALIGGSDADLEQVLDGVEIDPGFVAFAAWCQARDLPIHIVSDGVDRFIDRILARVGLSHLPVYANRMAGEAGARILEQPWSREGCAAGAGVCKCALTGARSSAAPSELVYVGDGRSDFCVSARASLLFAKGALADYAAARSQAFLPFDTFHDVARELARLIDRPADVRAAS